MDQPRSLDRDTADQTKSVYHSVKRTASLHSQNLPEAGLSDQPRRRSCAEPSVGARTPKLRPYRVNNRMDQAYCAHALSYSTSVDHTRGRPHGTPASTEAVTWQLAFLPDNRI